MNIVYCGALWEGSTALMRLEALRTLGHKVRGVDSACHLSGLRGGLVRWIRRSGYHPDSTGLNRRLLEAIVDRVPDLVWIDKGLVVAPATLRTISATGVRVLHYSPDDMSGRHNQSWQYLRSIPLYDVHVTTKSFNVPELKRMGARSVVFVNKAFCSKTHRPIEIGAEQRDLFGGPVGFIGGFERQRADSIKFLVEHGLPVRIWGGGKWDSWARSTRTPKLTVENRPLWGNDYAVAVCSFDICLGFLRKLNRDLQTARSIEIPACGTFLLAERTAEHTGMFEEGVEAEFFGSDEELLEKCRYYLDNPVRRERIARSGRLRCLNGHYSYEAHMESALKCFE